MDPYVEIRYTCVPRGSNTKITGPSGTSSALQAPLLMKVHRPAHAADPSGVLTGLNTFLSQTAEYALRVMTLLARHEPGQPLLARELSVESRIPAQYLSKILRRLVLAGLLESQKGRGGGFVLAHAPGEITFREVLAAVDAIPREDRCAFGWGKCDPSHACPLHSTWTGMSAYFQHWASTSTFAEVREAKKRKPAVTARARAPKPPRTRSQARTPVR